MPDVLPLTVDEHLAVVKATAPRYFKDVSDLTFRRRLWLAMLQRYGRLEFGASSHSCVWDVEYSQPEVRQYGDGGDLQFNEHDALQQLTVDVRGYTATDKLTKKQQLMNKGPEQIDNLYKNKSQRLSKRVRQALSRELYTDGYASQNGNRFIGINSFGTSGGTTNATDIVATPNDSYGGLNTNLQAYGGNWSSNMTTKPNAALGTDWPYGNGDVEYDFVSPLICNYTSSAWPSGQTDWFNNGSATMRFARITQTSRGAMDDDASAPFMHMLAPDLYRDFLEYQEAKQRILVPHKEADDLGFGDVMNFEGAMVHHEFEADASTGYGITPTMMDMFVLHESLIESVGPEWAIQKLGYLYLCYTFGNMRFQPKFFSFYKAVA